MRFKIVCVVCECELWVQGHIEYDTNATILRENDPAWDDACEHIRAGGDYDIKDSDYDSDPDYD